MVVDLSMSQLLVRIMGIGLDSSTSILPEIAMLNKFFNFSLQLVVLFGVMALVSKELALLAIIVGDQGL